MVKSDGAVQMTGEVLESRPPSRLVLSWVSPENIADALQNIRAVTFEIEAIGGVVRLNVVHDQLKPGSEMAKGHFQRLAAGALRPQKASWKTGKAYDIMAIKSCAQPQAKVA